MDNTHEIFELSFKKGRLMVEKISLPGQVFFRVTFPGNITALTLLSARDINKAKFWTSVPEGRQKLAAEIGPLIENYYNAKKI